MIIKGAEHNSARNLARYLLAPKENETGRLWELRDSATDVLAKALTDWEMIGRCKTKGSKILYHAHIRLCDNERMNAGQWRETIESLESSLGFTDCPRAIVGHEHAQKGLHVHVVWSRYDPEQNRLVKLGNDHQQHHRVAREAEHRYGLRPAIAPANENGAKKRRLSDREVRAIKDRGSDRERLAKLIRAAWESTHSGQEMRAMLKTLKIELVPGDRRDWVVQFKGLKMNPVRLLPDVKTADFRRRMEDVNLEAERQAEAMKRVFRRRASQLVKGDFEMAIQSGNDVLKGLRRTDKRLPQLKGPHRLRFDEPSI